MNEDWKKNWLVIVNPNAGAGKCWIDWPRIETLLHSHDIQFNHEFTLKRLHAIVLTRKYINEGYTKIIVVGGDGTMNEVINGVFSQKRFETSEIILGMIPVGTGNDWGRMFGISQNYDEAIRTILSSRTFIQDAGKVVFQNRERTLHRYFVNIAGLGFDAMVVKKSNRLKDEGRSNPLMYKYNILTSLFNFKSPRATIEVDGKAVTNKVFSVSVGICKYNGGGMMPLPDAKADDGLFDLTVIKKIARWDVIRSMKRTTQSSSIHFQNEKFSKCLPD